MPRTGLIALAALWVLPVSAGGQAWADAYRAGDYARAAALLQPIVADLQQFQAAGDPAPAAHLAAMYAEGLGVARDPIAACALARSARIAAEMSLPRFAGDVSGHQALVEETARFAEQYCGVLAVDDQRSALETIGCYAFGMPEQVLAVARVPFA